MSRAFNINDILIPERFRSGVNEDAVQRLMTSIETIGLQCPITVRWLDDDISVALVTGRHRLEAARRLGREDIECEEFDGDENDARLWEIAENLHRAELTEAERREHIAEWVRLTAEKVRHCAAPIAGGEQPAEQGIRKAAKELGIDERSVRRAVAAESLPEPVKAAADAVGLGTVKRAKLASEPTAEAQLLAIKREASKKDARKVNAQEEKEAAKDEADVCAEYLHEHIPAADRAMVSSWLTNLPMRVVVASWRTLAA